MPIVIFCPCSSSSSGTEHKENDTNPCKWTTCRRRRKASRPQRSASKNDPFFRGVTFSVETRVSSDSKHDARKMEPKMKTQLHITSFFR